MIFKTIHLDVKQPEFSDDIAVPLFNQVQSIETYLERCLRPLKFKANFNRVVIVLTKKANEVIEVNTEKALGLEIPFDSDEYLALKEHELNDYFTRLLITGIKKCSEKIDIPHEALYEGLRKFKAGGFINEWCYKRRIIKELGVKAHFNCSLTLDHFILTLVLEKKGKIIFEKEIMQKGSYELYQYFLNDVVYQDGKLIVIAKPPFEPVYQISEAELNHQISIYQEKNPIAKDVVRLLPFRLE